MCVIIVKPAGVKMPSLDILEKMWNCNRDGAGLAISNKRNVTIDKGFMTFEALKDYYERKQLASMTYKLVVVHFRIGTHGLKDGGNTHPFPMGSTPDEIRRLELTAKEAIFHNGVFSLAVTEKHVSDTGQFIIDAAKKGEGACILSHWDTEKTTTGWSKLCVVRPAGCYDLRGTWTYSDSAEGCLVSNTGWTSSYVSKDYHDEAWGNHGKKGKKDKKHQTSTLAPGYYSAWDDEEDNWWARKDRVAKEEKLIAPFEDKWTIRPIDLKNMAGTLGEFFTKKFPMNDFSMLEFDAKAWAAKYPLADPLCVVPFVDEATFGFRSEIPDRLKDCFRWVQAKGQYMFDMELWENYREGLVETVIDNTAKAELESNVVDVEDKASKEVLVLDDLIYDDEYEWAALMVPDYLWDAFVDNFYQEYNASFVIEEVYDFIEQDGIGSYWFNDRLLDGTYDEEEEEKKDKVLA